MENGLQRNQPTGFPESTHASFFPEMGRQLLPPSGNAEGVIGSISWFWKLAVVSLPFRDGEGKAANKKEEVTRTEPPLLHF